MKAERILLPLLILPWIMNAAPLHLKKRAAGHERQANGTDRVVTSA
jgi:hypothetical protein